MKKPKEQVDDWNVRRKAAVQEKMLTIKRIVETRKQLDVEELNRILFGEYVDSYNRFGIFLQVKKLLSGSVYWRGLENAYTMSDNLFRLRKEVRNCFESKEHNREALMNVEEQQYLDNLPDKVTIYRGMTVKEKVSGKYGVSWTLDENIAKYYRDTYPRNHDTKNEAKTIVKLVIDKSDIIAVLQGRNEFEVIYLQS